MCFDAEMDIILELLSDIKEPASLFFLFYLL